MKSTFKQLERRIELEQIVSRMARNFVHLERVVESIHNALKEIGEFSGASRAYIFEFQSNGKYMDNTHEWCGDGVSSEIENLKSQEVGIFTWWWDQIKSGEVLNIHDVSKLGPEAQAERNILEMQDIKSALVMPLIKKGALYGFVGFDNINTLGTWHDDDEAVLATAAELFNNVFERLESERELTSAKDELEASISSLQLLQAQLIHQEHMAAIGQLAAGVAHEINNPLSFVLSNQETLKQYTEKLLKYANATFSEGTQNTLLQEDLDEISYIQEDLSDLFNDINTGLSRVKKIVDSLRFFSRIDSTQSFEPYNVVEGVKNTLVMIHSRLSDGIKLKLDIQNDLPEITVHGSKINQVLLNLIVNAIDAIVEKNPTNGGELIISVKSLENTNVEDKRNVIQIQISDDGIGMTEEVLQKIYNPFFTTKAVGKGTGLGMILVYDIIKNLHKGDVDISSEPGVGTTVTITLGDVLF
ncbi:MAG TPA: hypothetical protein DCS67_05455 [Clostridiales bacterium UBA8960]|nr:hypothetical protein [Clostridiales bacterium UBA8960]